METIDGIALLVGYGFKIYFYINLAAILITWLNPDPNHPAVYYLNRLTHPFWAWVETRAPSSLRFFSAYLALLLIQMGEMSAPLMVHYAGAGLTKVVPMSDALAGVFFSFLRGASLMANSLLFILMLLAIVWFVITLLNPPYNNRIVQIIHQLIDPLITPLQGLLPRTKTDLSPLVLAVILYLGQEGVDYLLKNWVLVKMSNLPI